MERLKSKKIILFVFLMTLFLVFPLSAALAQNNDYELLAPLPELKSVPQDNPLGRYIPYIFNLLIGLAAVTAVVMIVLGGFQYMTTDAVQGKEQGRERIKNAIIGLVLVISAWLILYTINPNLLNIDLTIDPAVVSSSGTSGTVTAGTPMTTQQITESNSVRDSLSKEDVWAYRGACEQGQTRGCVNLNGLPDTAKAGLVVLNRTCDSVMSGGCNIMITGGTEGGHATHGVGKPMVDLRPDANLNRHLGFPTPKEGDTVTKTYKIDGKPDVVATFTFEKAGGNAAGTSTGDHWHVSFR